MSAFPQADDWTSEFAESTVFSFLPDGVKEGAPSVCAEFLQRLRDSTEAELRRVLLEEMPTLDLPPQVRPALPGILGSLFDWLEDTGRLGGGRSFARFVEALRPAYAERCSPKGGLRVPPIVKKTPNIGRNDPCPCGSGRKFKRCCAT